MTCNATDEKRVLLLKIERPIFAHQEEFDNKFQKTEAPPVKNSGRLHKNCLCFSAYTRFMFQCIF